MVKLQAELRRIASAALDGEQRDHTLQATALIHEAYLRLARQRNMRQVSRPEFLVAAAGTMRRVLVDHARSRGAQRRGGGAAVISLTGLDIGHGYDVVGLLAFNDAIESLKKGHERMGTVAELRCLGGLSLKEIAGALDVSERTVSGDWAFARAWLRRELAE